MEQVDISPAVDLWSQVLTALKTRISEQSFTTWIQPLAPLRFENNALWLGAPSSFHREWIESHFGKGLNAALRDSLNDDAAQVRLTVTPRTPADSPPLAPSVANPPLRHEKNEKSFETHLNPRYQFDTFIEGNSNSFARAACLAVADVSRPCPWNPLLIYGGTGLGKTHLLQAIGNRVVHKNKHYRVVYVSSERFTQDFIQSVRTSRTSDFAQHYRSIDLLLVDDIQFFATKERTQQEFFHAFNTLYQNGKRIVLTSDRPVTELAGFDERLISRFASGFVTNIDPPDYETRVAILQNRAQQDGFPLADNIANLLATHITGSVRDLEGAYVTLAARCQLTRVPPTTDAARDVIRSRTGQAAGRPPAEKILDVVADHFHIPREAIKSKSRKKELVFVRMIAMTLMTEYTSLSLKAIGEQFGGRDHSTVIHARDTIQQRRQAADAEVTDAISVLTQKLSLFTLPSAKV